MNSQRREQMIEFLFFEIVTPGISQKVASSTRRVFSMCVSTV